MTINILALHQVFDTGLATVLDAFAVANELAEMFGLTPTRFDVTVVGIRRTITTSQGLSVPVTLARTASDPDLTCIRRASVLLLTPVALAVGVREVSACIFSRATG